jgi:hypothetical protein
MSGLIRSQEVFAAEVRDVKLVKQIVGTIHLQRIVSTKTLD